MALPVAVDNVEGWNLKTLESRLELFKVVGFAHVPILLQHAWTIQTGDTECDGVPIGLDEDRTLDGRSNRSGLVLQGTIFLLYPDGTIFRLEGKNLAIEQVTALSEREFIGGISDDLIDGVGKAKIVVEAETQDRQSDLCSSIHVDTRPFQLSFVVGELARGPGKMGIGKQQSVAAGGLGRSDGPGV